MERDSIELKNRSSLIPNKRYAPNPSKANAKANTIAPTGTTIPNPKPVPTLTAGGGTTPRQPPIATRPCNICKDPNHLHFGISADGKTVTCPVAIKNPKQFEAAINSAKIKRETRIASFPKKTNMISADNVNDIIITATRNIEFAAQIDSGSASSIIPESCIDSIGPLTMINVESALKVFPTLSVNLSDYQGKSLEIKGVIIVEIESIRTTSGNSLNSKRRAVPFLVSKGGSNIILGRPSCGRKGLNILRHFSNKLDSNLNDTLDINQIDHSLISSMIGDSENELPELGEDWEDEEENEVELKISNIQVESDLDKMIKVKEQANKFYASIENQKPVPILKVHQIQEQDQNDPPVIRLVNPLGPCPISDEKFKALSFVHNSKKGHHKKTLYKKVNKDRDPNDLITMTECQQFIRYCYACQKMSYQATKSVFPYNPSIPLDRPFTVLGDVLELDKDTDVLVLYNPASKECQYHMLKNGNTAKEIVTGTLAIRSRGFRMDKIIMRQDKGSQQTADEAQSLMKALGNDILFGIAGSHQDQSEIERQFLEIRKHFIPAFQQVRAKYPDVMEISIAIAFTIYNTIESNLGVAPWELTRPFDHLLIEEKLLDEVPEAEADSLINTIHEIQDILLEKMVTGQNALFKLRADQKAKKGEPKLDIKIGMPVLIQEDKIPNKVAWKKIGPDIVVDLVRNPITGQLMAQLHDPTGSAKEDRLVHPSRLTPFYYDIRCGKSLSEIRALDTGEFVIKSVLKHQSNTPDEPSKLRNYDLQVLWNNGYTNWMSWDSICTTDPFKDYMFDHREEFKQYFNRLSNAEKKKASILPTIFQKRRQKLPEIILVNEPAHNVEVTNSMPAHAISFMGNKDWDYGLNDLVGITMDDFHNVDSLTYEDILKTIAGKFGPGGQDQNVLDYFMKKGLSNPQYPKVFSDLEKNDFIIWKPIELNIKDSDNIGSNPIRPINNPEAQEAYNQIINKMIREGRCKRLPKDTIIKFNNTPNMVIDSIKNYVKKWRLTFDARKRNDITPKKPWSTRLSISERIRKMDERYKNSGDARSAFYQVEMSTNSKEWLRWICPITGDKYELQGMDMGGVNSPAELQDIMDTIFEENSPYVDDFIWSESDPYKCIDTFFDIVDKCVLYNVKLNYDKILLIQDTIKALGKIVDGDLVRLDNETKEKILNAALPKNSKQLQAFLGVVNWGRDNLADFSTVPPTFPPYLSKVLTPMINEPTMNWTPERIETFNKYKDLAVNSINLHFFKSEQPFCMATDACKKGWGAILFHLNSDGSKRIFAISSGTFSNTEMNWTINELEAYAIVKGFRAFKTYISGRPFKLFTDHKNLTFIHAATSPKIIRWRADMNQYPFIAYHVPGPLNWETDYLSRLETEPIEEIALNANA